MPALMPEQRIVTQATRCLLMTIWLHQARSVIENVGEHLGRAIAITVNLFNPQKVLIAGEITAAEEILIPAIRRCVEHQSLPSFHRGLPIVKARFQNQPTIGGFALVKRSLLEGDLLQIIMEQK